MARTNLRPFHLAIPVHDLDEARAFYMERLGCSEGRSAERWIDFDLYGHQVVVHLREDYRPDEASTLVDGHGVPCPHFGVVLDLETWKSLAESLRSAGTEFIIEPTVRFKGEVGEQATMFFRDPSGNALEFKALAELDHLFAR